MQGGNAVGFSYAFVCAPIAPDVAPFPLNDTRTYCCQFNAILPCSPGVFPATAIQYDFVNFVSNHTWLAFPAPPLSSLATNANVEMALLPALFVNTAMTVSNPDPSVSNRATPVAGASHNHHTEFVRRAPWMAGSPSCQVAPVLSPYRPPPSSSPM